MNVSEMQEKLTSIAETHPYKIEISALLLIKEGEWEAAHRIVQELPSVPAAWIHGLLHWQEGDLWNADYWYRQAGEKRPKDGTIDSEWERIAQRLAQTK